MKTFFPVLNRITKTFGNMEATTVPKMKLFAIATALAMTPAVIAQDSTPDKVYLEADALTDDQNNGVMIAEGNVIARYEGRQLSADKVIYNLETQKVRAIGNVQILDPDGTVRTADEIEVDEQLSDGVATGFTAQLPQNAVVVARAATRTDGGTNSLDYAIYTACPICEEEGKSPTWTLRARRAVQNAETQMISYNDAVFSIKGVPVLYLPYFSHPDPSSKRRSGLLTPTPELSSKLGLVWEQPYYWAISPSQDMTITPKLYTGVNSALDLAYRKKFFSGQLDISGSLAYDYEFDSNGDRQFYNVNGAIVEEPDEFSGTLIPSEEKFRGHIFAQGLFNLTDTWQWGFAAENVTDDLYLRRYNIDGWNDPRGLLDTAPNRLLSQAFLIGQTEDFYTDIASFHVQGLGERDNDGNFARVVPMAFANKLIDFGDKGLATFEGSLALLDRSEGDDTRRGTVSAEWQNAYVAPAGLVVEPLLKVRADYYDFSVQSTSSTPGFEDAKSRTSALAAATVRWPFIRRGEDSTVTIEPIVTFGYGEASLDNGELPVEDSALFEYDLPVLFKADPFTEYDLIEQGSRVVAGLRAKAQFDDFEVRGTIGQRFRDEVDPFFEIGSNLGMEKSDYVAGFGFDIGDNLKFDSTMRLDKDFDIRRIEAQTEIDWWRISSGFTYFNIDEDVAFGNNPTQTQGIAFRSQFELTDSLDLSYSINRNLETNLNQRQFAGVRWSDDCSFFIIGWEQRQISDRGVGDSESIVFGFGFNTIGAITTQDFD
tara:strand:+ start:32854 stop:35157 length:2304 start_codon:yes stop_codon:yes gene_type:complete